MSEKQQGLYVFKNGDWKEISSKLEVDDLPIATGEQLGAVKIGKGLDIDKSGILSTKTASKEAIESGVSDDEFITPKGLSESKEEIVKSVKAIVKSVNAKKPTADGNVDLGELVHSVAGIASDSTGDVPLSSKEINKITPIPLTERIEKYPYGISVFMKNDRNDGSPSQYGTITTMKDASFTALQFFSENGISPSSEGLYYRIFNDFAGWTDWYKVMSGKDLSDSTTYDSSDTVATSKAVYKLQQEISELRNAIIELGGKL